LSDCGQRNPRKWPKGAKMNEVVSLKALQDQIAKLQADNAALRHASDRKLSCKVTDKGGVSVYGLGRFPVTLYASQWDKLLAGTDMIRAFLTANRSLLSTKD